MSIFKGSLASVSTNLITLSSKVDQLFLNLKSTVKTRAYRTVLMHPAASPSSSENPTLDPEKSAPNSTEANHIRYQPNFASMKTRFMSVAD